MIRFSILVCVWLLCAISGIYGGPLDDAETAYQNSRYDQAITIYQQLLEQTPRNPQLLYNLGNSYFKNNQLGYGLAYYLKAQRFGPRTAHLQDNIDKLRKEVLVDDETEQYSLTTRFFRYVFLFSVNEVVSIWLLVMTGLAGLLLVGFFRKEGQRFRHIRLVVFGGLILLSMVSLGRVYFEHSYQQGVVVQSKVEVRSGPSEALPVLFFLHDGTEFRIVKRLDQWVEVSLANGLSGWIQERDILGV